MFINFGDFSCHLEKGVLYKHCEIVPLKRNQIALLLFFLEDEDTIHSKDDILDAIWRDQDVSQQVVFQTISELRSILGNSVIRTFSKKGYKWNSPTVRSEDNLVLQKTLEHTQTKALKTKSYDTVSNKKPFLYVTAIVLISVLLYLFPFKQKSEDLSFYILSDKNTPINDHGTELLESALQQMKGAEYSYMDSNLYPEQVFASPSLILRNIVEDSTSWSLWGERLASERGEAYLRYGLFRNNVYWEGYVVSDNEDLLSSLLAERLFELRHQGLFSGRLQLDNIESIKMALAKMPHDYELQLILARLYKNIENDDVAMTYLQRLVKNAKGKSGVVYRIPAYLEMASIYKEKGQSGPARDSLLSVKRELIDTKLWPYYFKYIESFAWLMYENTNYDELQQFLKEAEIAIYGNMQQNSHSLPASPLLLFKFHILNSILAKKTDDDAGKYQHLNQAQNILIENQLDRSNLAVVFYHLALFAKQERDINAALNPEVVKLKNDELFGYLNKILDLSRTDDNGWVHDAAFELLVQELINIGEFELALTLFPETQLSPTRQYLKGEVLLAQNLQDQSLILFESAFDQARIQYDTRTAIDAALRLYQLSSKTAAQSPYLAYLQSNASEAWLSKKLN